MKCIALVDSKWGIAKDGKQMVFIKEDIQRLKKMTLGKTVIMGRKTFESLNNKKGLPNRRNIIVSSSLCDKCYPDIEIARTPMYVNYLLEGNLDDVYVLGGAEIYKLFLPYCDTIHLSIIKEDLGADTFFPKEEALRLFNWDLPSMESMISESRQYYINIDMINSNTNLNFRF